MYTAYIHATAAELAPIPARLGMGQFRGAQRLSKSSLRLEKSGIILEVQVRDGRGGGAAGVRQRTFRAIDCNAFASL